jgi:FAD/FMN-containing dehydrogenase
LAAVVAGAVGAGRTVRVTDWFSGWARADVADRPATLVRLDRCTRLLEIDRGRHQVTVQAGITLVSLNRTLAYYGLALPNLGDVDWRTLSVALSTGVHGSAAGLGCLATQVVAMDVVVGDGSTVSLSAQSDPEGFRAAQVALGALGVISTVTLQCVPAFNLHAQQRRIGLDDAFEAFDELAGGNDYFELSWLPRSRFVLAKRANRTEARPSPRSWAKRWFDDALVGFWVPRSLAKLRRARPRLAGDVIRRLPAPPAVDYVDRCYRFGARPRTVPFTQMEYSVGRSQARAVLDEVRALVEGHDLQIGVPLTIGVTGADEMPLSMANGRPSCFVTVRMFVGQEPGRYFKEVQTIMDAVGGRPHWGKHHAESAATLRPRYPRWDEFQSARRRFDPEGRFSSLSTERVLGPVS